jgi:Cys-tRNA synthase (O-phospho-L-seryl-tRNA:Cys-tRNA synthase)
MRRLFTVLAYKTKIMTANWIVAERLILPIRVVTVGDKERPATAEDVQDTVNQLAAVANDPNLTIVTHHNFKYDYFGATGKIVQLSEELTGIGKEILDGFMLNEALLNGNMAGYNSAQVGIETMIRRLDNWRNKLAKWIEKKIFLPTAMMNGFIDEEKTKK